MRETARLTEIQNGRSISIDGDSNFVYEFQKSILLALTEQGILNEMQYRYAEEKIKDQVRTRVKKNAMREKKGPTKEDGWKK